MAKGVRLSAKSSGELHVALGQSAPHFFRLAYGKRNTPQRLERITIGNLSICRRLNTSASECPGRVNTRKTERYLTDTEFLGLWIFR